MPYLSLKKTEKAYNLLSNNIYTLVFDELSFKPNKIEVNKILKKHGLNAIKIRTLNPYSKTKFRKTRANKILISRPKKYIVRLVAGQTIADDLRLEA